MPQQSEEEEDLFLLAKLIGIEPTEPEYFWIAKEAYNADLPGGWEIFFDDDGKPFYFDTKTQKTTYEHPSIDFYRLLYRDLKEKDKEDRMRQEAQELLFGRPTLSRGSSSSKTAADKDATLDDEAIERNNKAKLLQAFSNDPNLSAKYREEVREQESRATEILKAAMRKEEEIFIRRLKLYTAHKSDAILKPLEERIAQNGAAQEARLEDALRQISMIFQGQAANQGPPPKSGTSDLQVNRTELLNRRNKRSTSGPEDNKGDEVLKKLQEDILKLQEEKQALLTRIDELEHSARQAAQASAPDSTALDELKAELEIANARAKALEKENQSLKSAFAELKSNGGQNLNEISVEMDDLSNLATRLERDVSAPARDASSTPSDQAIISSSPSLTSDAVRVNEMSEEMLLHALERMEALSGSAQGPIFSMKSKISELEGRIREIQEENSQLIAHSTFVEEMNTENMRSLSRLQAVEQELQRAKDHSENMEFLAKQYSDQLVNLHATMKKLRDDVQKEQVVQAKEASLSRNSISITQPPPITAQKVAKTPADSQKELKFIVRIRSSTLLDVKKGSSALRVAVNLLKTDFLAYAEGIFLPLSRQLQRQTLYLATALSVKSRELRMSASSLGCSLTAQKLLEEKLSAVYSVPFHSVCMLRPCAKDETSIFRPTLPTQLTMQLRDGFENKRGIYETYEFDKVFGPDCDAEAVFHELLPFASRVLNWKPFCLIVKGGRQSDKMSTAMGKYDKNENGQLVFLPGLMEHFVQFMTHFFNSEKDKLLKERLQEEYELQLYVDFCEVWDENITNYTSATNSSEEGESVSLRDVQEAFLGPKSASGLEEAAEQEAASDEGANEDDTAVISEIPPESTLPSYKIGKTDEALRLVNDLYQRSQAKTKLRQEALGRNASETVQRGKRLAVPGSRNELGELIQEPHYVVSIMIEKRERATDQRDLGLLRIVVLGSPAEFEDTSGNRGGVSFREEPDASSEAISEFVTKKFIRSTDIHAVLPESKLSLLVSDVLNDPSSSAVLLSAVSPASDHFDCTVRDLRYACKSSKSRPTTAIRLERVKFRWSNQSIVWAFTLWKGAVADTIQIQQSNTIANQLEEIEELKGECKTLRQQLEKMATDGVAYSSAVESEQSSDDEQREDADAYRAQQKLLEKTMKKELQRNKEKIDGAIVQAVAAKLQYTQSQFQSAVSNNRSLAEMLKREKQRGKPANNLSSSSSHMPDIRRRSNDLSTASTRSLGALPSRSASGPAGPSPVLFVRDKNLAQKSLAESGSVLNLSSVRYSASLTPGSATTLDSAYDSAEMLPPAKKKAALRLP